MRECAKRLTRSDVDLLTGRDILLQLREFLIAYRVFASGATSTGEESGQHNPYEFSTQYGLCFNMRTFTVCITDNIKVGFHLEILLDAALDVQFEMWIADNQQTGNYDDADIACPFGEADFYARIKSRTQHECPKRLAFVSHTIEVLLV